MTLMLDCCSKASVPPAITYISEPMTWESVVAQLQFQGKTLRSITLRPIALNYVGNGQPDVHSQYTTNEFLLTRGLPNGRSSSHRLLP